MTEKYNPTQQETPVGKNGINTELSTHNGLRSYEELVHRLHLSPWEVEKFLIGQELTRRADLEGDDE